MRIKPGARIQGLSNEIVIGLMIANEVWKAHKQVMTITGGIDGVHMRGSKHYSGDAVDIRCRDLPEDLRGYIYENLKDNLGPDYDVVLERDHFHIEYHPKVAINAQVI